MASPPKAKTCVASECIQSYVSTFSYPQGPEVDRFGLVRRGEDLSPAEVPHWWICRHSYGEFACSAQLANCLTAGEMEFYMLRDCHVLQSIGASLALKKWGDWNVALWVSVAREGYLQSSPYLQHSPGPISQ